MPRSGATPSEYELSPMEYVKSVLDGRGRILHMNIVGALTLVTSYRELGQFETVYWSGQVWDTQDLGFVIGLHETLEVACAFHLHLVQAMQEAGWGRTTLGFFGVVTEEVTQVLKTITTRWNENEEKQDEVDEDFSGEPAMARIKDDLGSITSDDGMDDSPLTRAIVAFMDTLDGPEQGHSSEKQRGDAGTTKPPIRD